MDGSPERHPEGTYYIEWYENGVRRRLSVKDSSEVLEQARRKAIELDAGKAGIVIAESKDGQGLRVGDAVKDYLKEIEPPQREPRTYGAYKHCLELFAQNCRKTYLRDVTREDVLGFIRKLYDLGCGPRTAYNRAVIVCQLLKLNGLRPKRSMPVYLSVTTRAMATPMNPKADLIPEEQARIAVSEVRQEPRKKQEPAAGARAER